MTYMDFQHEIGINIIDPGDFSQSVFFFLIDDLNRSIIFINH